MKKFLPLLLFVLFLAPLVSFASQVVAQEETETTDPAPPVPEDVPADPPEPTAALQKSEGIWVADAAVTFAGKNAARAAEFLDWNLKEYSWIHVSQNSANGLIPFWTGIRNIVYVLLILIVLATAFILIVTRGKSIKARVFLPRFIAVVLLITLSFSLIQFIYTIVDILMGFFLRNGQGSCPPACISQKDLLYIGWKYTNFIGLRLTGDTNTESAFISLLLVKLTALTYYVMVGMLMVRKVMLWFFIIVSPIFPLLLLYYPVRNTGKIWIGEFFRWLLYGPLFALFLGGLVSLWRSAIPLLFDFSKVEKPAQVVYPTSVNILIGGPQQFVTFYNNINYADTLALYIFSLIMLWMVIILPWILLQIFLDFAMNGGLGTAGSYRQILNKLQRPPSPSPSPVTPPPQPFGVARNPFTKTYTVPPPDSGGAGLARQIPKDRDQQVQIPKVAMPPVQVTREILRDTKVTVPTIRDIARLETKTQEATQITQNLRNIANPAGISSMTDRQKFTQIREKLVTESKQGNIAATNILNAAKTVARTSTTNIQTVFKQIANPATVTVIKEREKLTEIKETLLREVQKGNQLAATVLATIQKPTVTAEETEKVKKDLKEAEGKGDPLAIALLAVMTQATETTQTLPTTNRIQQVSLDDYEAIKSMWGENYQNMDVPQSVHGQMARKDWVADDINQISATINLLSSPDTLKQQEGMKQVSNILPFLMIGGFSQTEITAYLKAKLEAAKSVKTQIEKKEQEEDSMVETKKRTEEAQKTMTTEAAMPLGEQKPREVSPLPENPAVTGEGLKDPADTPSDKSS